MSEAPELLPCPFCGELLALTDNGYTHNRRVRGAKLCLISWVAIRPPHYSAWNTRADLPATDEQALTNPRVRALVEAGEREDRAHGNTIDQRDAMEQAFSRAYELVMARPVVWSSAYHTEEALRDMEVALAALGKEPI